ncbi:MAG: sugar kinase [Desulfobacteraceae bacterium]|nr:MAG: sugar kinase [Desulfobacteraceae bacterium]
MPETKRLDVTSIGSTMLRLSVSPGERVETAPHFAVHTAGTEGNTLAALSRMGFKTGWVSRLKDDVIGHRIAGDLRAFGVDTSRVIWTEEDRNEIFFVEYGLRPRGVQVLYDRSGSAISKIRFEEVDLRYLFDARIFHMTGIFPALSQRCLQVSEKSLAAAGEAGITTSFDVNYRAKLWTPRQAAKKLEPLMRMCDILLMTREDAADLFGITGTPDRIIRDAHSRFRPSICVMTLAEEGGIAYDGSNAYRTPAYPVEVLDRLGAGDSFTAGFLCGWLEGSIQTGMNYGAAMAALKLGIKGDYFVSNRREVLRLLELSGSREIGR